MEIERIDTKVGFGVISAGGSSITVPINIPFQVDDIVVKSVSYTNSGTISTDMILVRTDMLGHEPLCAFPEASSMLEMLNNVFQINKPELRGEYVFTLYDFDDNLYTSDGDVDLSITISFIKYKK